MCATAADVAHRAVTPGDDLERLPALVAHKERFLRAKLDAPAAQQRPEIFLDARKPFGVDDFSRTGNELSEQLVEQLRTGQVKLANEQARYEIAFRQDLAALAEQVRRGR